MAQAMITSRYRFSSGLSACPVCQGDKCDHRPRFKRQLPAGFPGMKIEIAESHDEGGVTHHNDNYGVRMLDGSGRYEKIQYDKDQQQPLEFGHAARKPSQLFLFENRGCATFEF
jgi:hypothetical protein